MAGVLLHRCKQCRAVVTLERTEDVAAAITDRLGRAQTLSRHDCGGGYWGVIELVGGMDDRPREGR